MDRRKIGLVSSTLLLPAAVFLAVTGLISDVLDLNEFVFHKYTGYAAAVLALVHVAAHWPSLVAFWTGRSRRRYPAEIASTAPVPISRARPASTPASAPRPTEASPRGFPRRAVLAAAGVGATGFAAG